MTQKPIILVEFSQKIGNCEHLILEKVRNCTRFKDVNSWEFRILWKFPVLAMALISATCK